MTDIVRSRRQHVADRAGAKEDSDRNGEVEIGCFRKPLRGGRARLVTMEQRLREHGAAWRESMQEPLGRGPRHQDVFGVPGRDGDGRVTLTPDRRPRLTPLD